MLRNLLRRLRREPKSPLGGAIEAFRRSGEKFVYADVGSAGGIPDAYRELSRAGCAKLVLFDPQSDWRRNGNPNEYHGCDIVAVKAALAGSASTRPLHVTAAPGCSSFLKPNQEVLAAFPVREWFAVTSIVEIQTTTFALAQGTYGLQAPDILKIDVQGAELEVLEGFGASLRHVSFIELEVNLEPLYEGQPTLSEVYAFMKRNGFVLRDFKPQGPFEGAAIEFNSFWSRAPASFTARQRTTDDLWRAVHGVWAGEYFAQAADGARAWVRFTD
jgi:FkbM family methyltransferase